MPVARLRTSIIVIGDEILGGYVQDTNSSFLARRLQTLGIPLDRIVTVPDALPAIGEALAGELVRSRPRLVLTSGGIGSTPDDVTFAAVAAQLGRGLVVDPDIDGRITAALEWTAQQGATVSAAHERAMRKMARVPEGAYLLAGASGVAPGVAVDVDGGIGSERGATLVVLPGIPDELQRITAEGIEPLLAGRGEPQHVVELTHPYPESTLNPALDRVVVEFPDVHVGSYPGPACTIRLTGRKDRVEGAERLMRAELDALEARPGSRQLAASWRARFR